jgi:hypothetical protein
MSAKIIRFPIEKRIKLDLEVEEEWRLLSAPIAGFQELQKALTDAEREKIDREMMELMK